MKNAGYKIRLIEMWGYFLGREYTHRRYGPNAHSELLEYYNPTGASPTSFLNSWYAVNENRGNKLDHRFESNGHIAACFLHDLVDNNEGVNPSLAESDGVIDRISGFTISTIFNNMNSNTTTAAGLINNLRNNLPNSSTLQNYDSLRLSYGY